MRAFPTLMRASILRLATHLVEAIKPLARATARTGTDSALGGFGGLFDLKACGYKDPVLVAANDGVGTKLRIAIETGIHGTVGIDLVAMSVNDLVVQGAEPLFFLDYFATGKLDVASARTSLPVSPRDAAGLAVHWWVAKRRKCRACIMATISISRALPWALWSAIKSCRERP